MIKFLFIVLVCFLGVFIGFWWGCNDWSFWLIVSVSCCKSLLDYRFDDPLPYFTSDLQEHIESSVSSAATICLYFWFPFQAIKCLSSSFCTMFLFTTVSFISANCCFSFGCFKTFPNLLILLLFASSIVS